MKQSIQPKETTGSGSRPPFFAKGDGKGFFQTSRPGSSFFSSPSRPPAAAIQPCAACEKEELLQKKEALSAEPPANLQEHKVVDADPPAEVFMARKSNVYYAIPSTYTSLTQLAKFVFQAANDNNGDGSADATSPLATIRQSLKDMNGLIREEVYPMDHICLGDLRMRFAPTARMKWVTANTVIFSNDVQNPEAELSKMGVSSLDEFFQKKIALDAQWMADRFLLVGLVRNLADADIPEHLDIEPKILNILERWAHEPLVTSTDTYPEGGQYFDKMLTYLAQIIIDIGWISDEKSSLYSILFNHSIIIRRDLDFYLGKYGYANRGDKPTPEMSVWSDFAKPALLRIPIAINEEAACFIESLPGDAAKDVAEWIHGKDQEYADAVLPNEGKANQDTMDIACFFGGVMFDLADPAAEIMELLKDVQSIEDLYAAFKEVDSTIENLPKLLTNFNSTEKLINILFGIDDNPELDSLETWVNSQQPTGGHAGSPGASPDKNPAAETGLAKFRKVISELISTIKLALRTIFAIRRKFIEFIDQAQDTLVSNPLFVKALTALMAGRKIAELADGNLSEKIIVAVDELLNALKEKAMASITDFLKAIEGGISGILKGIQDGFVNAITNFALEKFSKNNPKIRILLRLDTIKKKAVDLISDHLVGPFLKRIFLDDMMKDIESVADGITNDAKFSIDYVVDKFSVYIRDSFKQHHLQLQSKDSHNGGTKTASPRVENGMSRSSGHPLPEGTKGQMEGAFGTNFDSVRVHHDGHAREASEDLHANAFTRANDIYFNSGKYDPQSKEGQTLLAHELTHVVQQSGGAGPQPIQRSVQEVPRKVFSKILKDFFIDKNPAAKKFAGELHSPKAQPYERYTHHKVDAPAIDQKLLSMVLEERQKLLGTLKDSFSRNIAAAKIIINDDVKNPQYVLTRNRPTGQHSEEAIGGKAKKLLDQLRKKSFEKAKKSKKAEEAKKAKKTKKAKNKVEQEEKPVTVRIDQLYTERKPCQEICVPFMDNNPVFDGTKIYFTLPYSMVVNEPISRKEQLMREYGLSQAKIMELTKDDL